jgi:hypothetical protein
MAPLRPLLVGCALALLASGCSLTTPDDHEPPPPEYTPLDFSRFTTDTTELVGRWEWRQSTVYGPGTPHRTLADTADRSETLVFPSPDTVQVYQNDTLVRTVPRVEFLDRAQWGVRADTFATSTAYLDGPEKIYVRAD